MKKEFLTFIPDIKDLVEDREVEITIRDLAPGPRKYDARVVKAILSSDPGRLPEGDILWVRSWIGVLYEPPWAIKIIGDAGETSPGLPHGESFKAGLKR